MKTYEVYEGSKRHGLQWAESCKEAIRLTRMELLARQIRIGDEGWYAKELAGVVMRGLLSYRLEAAKGAAK
jgi:hypothetical protein